MKRIVFALLCGLGLLLAGNPALAQISNVNVAVNKAGRQRMLSQHLAKLYLQIGQGIDTERSQRLLDGSLALFDRQLVELKNYAPTPAIKDTYQKLDRAWGDYKDVLVGAAPSQANAAKVMALSEEVLALANQGTAQLEAHGGTPAARLVNVAGRERMLSQRLSKYYHARAWNIAFDAAVIEQTRKEFLAGLAELEAAPVNTDAIRDTLVLGRQQWVFFDAALRSSGQDRRALGTNVATTSERILEAMDSVTGMYEKLLK